MEDYIFMDEEQPKPNISKQKPEGGGGSTLDKVLAKIKDAESVLVALSNDPTVDEIAAAMGLSMALDAAGKHVTAIYSGKTPNALEFLKPEERFETGTESLQDFVIALDKNKADHLRYKIDGDFVKVYVTPYKTTISGDDIEFSRGDYNVDLVISLNVPAATELDAALKEHGRIMHDATSINITNGAAGKFGDLEWVEPEASSISEMVSKLAFGLKVKIDAATATALLTGLVAATDRFKSPATTPEAMAEAAKLMGAGADQQLVVQNVQGEVMFNDELKREKSVEDKSETSGEGEKLDIAHETEKQEETKLEETKEPPIVGLAGNPAAAAAPAVEPMAMEAVGAPGVAEMVETTEMAPQSQEALVKAAMAEALNPTGNSAPATGTVAGVDVAVVPENADGYAGGALADQIVNNIEGSQGGSNVGATDYGKMIDEALNEPLPGEGGIQVGAETAAGPQVNTQDVYKVEAGAVPTGGFNAVSGPMPMPGQEMVPPPVAPMPDFGAMPPATPEMSPVPDMAMTANESYIAPAGKVIPVPPAPTPEPEPIPVPDVTVQPDVNAQIAGMGLPQVVEAPVAAPVAPTAPEAPADPSAFKIPGIHT